MAGQGDAHFFAVTDDVGIVGFGKIAVDINVEVLERTLVGAHQDIVVAETKLLGLGVELHTLAHVCHTHVALAPVKHDHRVDKQCQHKVDRHTSHHNDEPLPCRLGAELPRLRITLHLLGVHALVDHTSNLTITAERQPAHAVFGFAVLRFETKELAAPLADGDVEENKELLHPDSKELGCQRMSALVKQYKQRDGQNELEKLNQKDFHL